MMPVFQRLNLVQRLEENKVVVKRNKNNPGFWTIQFTLFNNNMNIFISKQCQDATRISKVCSHMSV
jgi:hypothetical protein